MISPFNTSKPLSLRKRAFSLVETVMALGVVSFALTTLISMMPIGLNIFRDSIQSTVQTDVLRQLTTQFQETPFSELKDQNTMIFYSDQGTKVTNPADGFLGVTYIIKANTLLPTDSGLSPNSNLKTAVVSFFTRGDRATSNPTPSMTNVLYLAPGVH